MPDSVPALDGHLLRVIAGGVTAPARRTASTRARERRYRRFLDALGVAVYTTDADGRITFYNEAAAAFWGRRPELGEEWCGSLRLFWPDGRPMRHDECPMALALRENRAVRGGEAIAERPDGRRVAFVPYPTPLRDDDGRLIGAVNVLVDVTERKRAEDALRDAARALEVSNAVKDEFLGVVSHELRTPVTTILGNARLLLDRGPRLGDDLRASMVADIAEDADRLHAIIENLLQLVRLGAGPQPDLEPQVVEHVVRAAVATFGRRRPGRVVRVSPQRCSAVVDADRTWLELLVDNLLSNADKYSPPGAVVDVELRVVRHEVLVTVGDRGMGFGDAMPDQLFQPFFRSEAARDRAAGMGVGLAVCKRIVDALGGRIWAAARDGGGAEVSFALPVAHDIEEASGHPEA